VCAVTGVELVFVAVVGGRFVLPLFIPRWPLPAIIACLVLDGIDQSIFQWFGYDPPGYQSYDKAMDVFYLAIAYLATLRNWQSLPAFRVSRFLYFYRLVGVVAFELTQVRALLLVFPNTFEYFFIAYEAIRSRWSTLRLVLHGWVVVAALIWVFVKLPQEYWIHVAQLDVTDTLQDYAWAWPLLIGLLVLLAAVLWFVVRPRLPEPDHTWRLAADPMPEEMDTAAEQWAWHAEWGAIRSWATVEKIVLVGLLSVIYSQTLPGVDASNLQLFVGVGVVVLANAFFTLAMARRSVSIESATLGFLARMAANVVFVLLADWLLGRDGGGVDAVSTLFYLGLISLITSLHDRYRPVLATRVVAERAAAANA
jgi:hypothetical protein